MSKLISVIIPVYQAEKYVKRCLDSVLNQTYKNLEIILINDGSTDKSVEIIESYAKSDDRITLLHQENQGAGAARNLGLEIAKGDYIGFVDSDDWIERDMYEYLFNIAERENADIAACDFYSVVGKNEKEKKAEIEKIECMDYDALMKFFFRINGEKSFYAVWNMLYKREIIGSCRFPEGKITEDLLFNYFVYCNCKKYVLSNQKKYYYFFNADGVTRKKLGRTDLALLKNWDIIIENTKKYRCEMENYANLNRWRSDFTLLSKAVLYGYDEKEITDEIISGLLTNLKKHRRILLMSSVLDWKRKLLLIYICLNPQLKMKNKNLVSRSNA